MMMKMMIVTGCVSFPVYSQTLVENSELFIPPVYSTPQLRMTSLEFRHDV